MQCAFGQTMGGCRCQGYSGCKKGRMIRIRES
jgi:hypothetical protein